MALPPSPKCGSMMGPPISNPNWLRFKRVGREQGKIIYVSTCSQGEFCGLACSRSETDCRIGLVKRYCFRLSGYVNSRVDVANLHRGIECDLSGGFHRNLAILKFLKTLLLNQDGITSWI